MSRTSPAPCGSTRCAPKRLPICRRRAHRPRLHVVRRAAFAAMVAATAVALVIAIVAWWFWPGDQPSAPTTSGRRAPIAQPAAAPRLSIVVLPFANLNNDPEQQYFADAVTEDLTTDLSRITDMVVISRNTAFTYKDKPLDTKQIGRELGVRYVLEGSVRRSANQLRVTAQLIDAETNAHLWADRFDRDTGDLFAVGNEITSRIAVALNIELITAEAARPTERPDALDYILRGRAVRLRPNSRDSIAEAIGLFEHALAVDPGSIEAQSRLAVTLVDRVLDFGSSSAEGDVKRAEELATKAVAASPRDWYAHHVRRRGAARAAPMQRGHPRIRDSVLALNRNWCMRFATIGRCKIHIGPIEEVIPVLEQAIRLRPPRSPNRGFGMTVLGKRICCNRTSMRPSTGSKSRAAAIHNPHTPTPRLAAAYGLKGETERATTELAEARRRGGEGAYLSLARHEISHTLRDPEHPCPCRGDLLRRSAQGRHAGGMSVVALLTHPAADR